MSEIEWKYEEVYNNPPIRTRAGFTQWEMVFRGETLEGKIEFEHRGPTTSSARLLEGRDLSTHILLTYLYSSKLPDLALKTESSFQTYFIRDTDTGDIKIGKSHTPEKRVLELVSATEGSRKGPLEIIFVIPVDVEKKLHDVFTTRRVDGEWFRDDGSILNYIESVRQVFNG